MYVCCTKGLFHIYSFRKFTTIFVIICRLAYFFNKKVINGVVCLIILLLAFVFHYTHQQLSTLIVHLYFTLSLSFMSFRRAKGPKRPAHGKVSLPAFCSRAASSIFQSSRHCLLNCSFDSWVVRNSFS